jgi:hypothetical protein
LSSWKARRILNVKKSKDFFAINALSATILIEQWFFDSGFLNVNPKPQTPNPKPQTPNP